MSYTTVLAIYPDEKIENLQELGNSWGSAPVIWDAMNARYLHFEHFWGDKYAQLWPLWKRMDIPEAYRAVLTMTYDRAYVRKEHYARAAQDIEIFLRDFPQDANRVNHWPALKALYLSQPDVPAIGLWCTSVSDNPFHGAWDDEKEAYGPPDWDECYEVYDALDALAENNHG